MQKEYSQMKEVLTFNFEKQDEMLENSEKLIAEVITTIESNEYNGMYDKSAKLRKIEELISDYKIKINQFKQ